MTTEEMTILESRVAQLGADAINLSIRIDARLDRQAERMSKIDTRIGVEMTAAYDRLDAQAIVVARRGEQIEKLQSVNASQSDRIDDLERAILEEAANVAGLGAHLENQATHQRAATLHQAERITTINDRLAIHVTRLDAHSSMLDSGEQMRQMDHNRTDQLEARIERQTERTNCLTEKLSDTEFQLEGKVDDLDKEHADRLLAVESELEDTTRTANSAEMEVNDAKMDVSTLEGKVDSLTADLSSLSHTVNYG